MKIAIDLNDVIRDYTGQFASYYKKNIDRTFDIDDVDVWTNDLQQIFPFNSKQDYLNFVYNDFPYEIYGCASAIHRNLPSRFTDWCKELEDLDEVPELCLVSTGEYDKTIGSTHFFLNKIGNKVRETHLLINEEKIWDKCDVLVTANPILLYFRPKDKISVKIEASYNVGVESDFEFTDFMSFMNDSNVINNIINFKNKNNGND